MKIGYGNEKSEFFETLYIDRKLSGEKIDEFLCFGCFGFFENESASSCNASSSVSRANFYLCEKCHRKLIDENLGSDDLNVIVHDFETGSLRDKNEK